MEAIILAGRVLFGGYFLMMGINHFLKFDSLAVYAKSKKVPAPKIAVLISGAMILLGGSGVVFNVYPSVSYLLIAVFLIPVSFFIHGFWAVQDPSARAMDKQNFLKNMALLGAALMLLALTGDGGIYRGY